MTQLLISSIVQALSFTGASYLFKLLEPDKYGAEQKRYHDALLHLQADKEKFVERETKRRNRIATLEKAKPNANADFAQTNKLFAQLAKNKKMTKSLFSQTTTIPLPK